MSVDLYSVQPVKSPSWNNYLLGVIRKLLDSGYKIKPFYCVFEGDLPSGAGISSSAALACGFGLALSELFNLNLQKAELIHVAQWAEHHFVGVKCGIMDQFACIMGKENHVIKLDCRKLEYEYCPLQLGDYCMLLVDTNVEHSLAISEYNVRRSECEFALDFFRQNGFENITDLRDVSGEMLESIKNILPQVIYNRCLYISTENARVLRAAECLKTGDLTGLGSLLFESHEGLSKLYEVSCPELDFLVTLAAKSEGVIGSRMMGGGFGGCTINLIHSASVGDFVIRAKSEYKTTFNKDLTYQLVKTGPGAHIIDNPRN
jgi:galactokinase